MQTAQGRVLPLIIDDFETLRSIWMPFILSGAIFVPDVENAGLGERIFLLLLLPGRQERISTGGQVVWINPAGGAARQGVGVRLLSRTATRTSIEQCLEQSPADGGHICLSRGNLEKS